jgi:hypothetical protein
LIITLNLKEWFTLTLKEKLSQSSSKFVLTLTV